MRRRVIASNAKQSIFLFLTAVDCFVASLLAMTVWETPVTESRGRGVLDRPVKPDDDSGTCYKRHLEFQPGHQP
jgi:hypothetical protein